MQGQSEQVVYDFIIYTEYRLIILPTLSSSRIKV